MFSSRVRQIAVVGALMIASIGSALAQSVPVKDYDVFVDLPTAFAFIKLPDGWKFIGKLDAEQLRRLPPQTLTSLLPPEDESVKLAAAKR